MNLLFIIMLITVSGLCVLATYSDLKEGKVHNKTLLVFAVAAAVLDAFYYGFFSTDTVKDFLLNFCTVFLLSLILYFTHCFAGGDCKLSIVLALAYPSGAYLCYKSSVNTLFFTLAIAVLIGYLYLLIASVAGLATGKTVFNHGYAKNYIFSFLRSYITATVYISIVNLMAFAAMKRGFSVPYQLLNIICICVALLVGRFKILRSYLLLGAALICCVLFSVLLKAIPFSANIGSYIFALVLMLCQMSIGANTYEQINSEKICKGTILSTASTLLFQSSRIRGLPALSKENLDSRLTEQEAEKVRQWCRENHIESLSAVRKIPFAVFIVLGFVIYFILWCVLNEPLY